MSSQAIYRLSQQKTTNNETSSNGTATATPSTSTATKATTIKLHFDKMQQKKNQQSQQLTSSGSSGGSGGGNIILLRGARNENGQIVIQNKHDIINFINEQQQKQKNRSTITTTTTGSLNQLPATTTVARKLVHTTAGGTEICTTPANITVVAKDVVGGVCGSNLNAGTAITTTNTILLQTPINASQLESVLLQTQGHLKKSTKSTVTPVTVTSTSLIANNEQQPQQRPFLLRNASRSLSTDSNRIGTIIDTSSSGSSSSNITLANSNNSKGPFVLQTLKRLEKSQSILVIRNTASSNNGNNFSSNTSNATSFTTLSSSTSSLATTATSSTPTLAVTASSSSSSSSSSTTFARAIKATLQQQQQQKLQVTTTNKLSNRTISTQSLSASAVANLLNATTANSVNKQQQPNQKTKTYLRFGNSSTSSSSSSNVKQPNKSHNSQFAGNANNNLASGGGGGSTPCGVADAIQLTVEQIEQQQIPTATTTQQQKQQQSNVPLGSDGEPIKLPDNLESLPRADSFPSQRHRWNTNEEIAAILISFDKHNEWQSKEVKTRPKSGSLLLYSRKKVRYRRDGYCWKKRKDGKTTREDHMKLKVQGTECIYGCYVHSAILPTFHRRCYWLLQNPDIVLVHYLNVPYPDDNKMAVIAPSITLWGDKKEWTKEELVSQLKPMLSTVTSDDDSDSGNDIEISTAETVESIVCQLMEKQRLSRQAALIKQLDCGCGDTACADGKTCTHPVLRRPNLMKSTATERQQQQRYADGNQQQQQQQLAATHAGSTPNVVVGSKLYTRWSERRMRDTNMDNHLYQQQQQQHQQFQVIPNQQQQQHGEHPAYQQQQRAHQLLATRNNLSVQQQQQHQMQQQRYAATTNQQQTNGINKNNSHLNMALQQKINIKSTNIEASQHQQQQQNTMMTTNTNDLISNQHHHHQNQNQQQNHMSTNSICDNKINRNTNNNNNNNAHTNSNEEANACAIGVGVGMNDDEAHQMNTDTSINNNNGSNYNCNNNNTIHQQQQQEFYKHQQQQTKIQPLSNSSNVAADATSLMTTTTTNTNATAANLNSGAVEPMCMSPEHHTTPPTLAQHQFSSLAAASAVSSSSPSSSTATATSFAENAVRVVESNSSSNNNGNSNNNNNSNNNINTNTHGCAVNTNGASNTNNGHSTSSTILDKQQNKATNDSDAMETAAAAQNTTENITKINNNNNNNSSQIESTTTQATNALIFFNETLDLSHEDIQRTLAANMPYGRPAATEDTAAAVAAAAAAVHGELNFLHNSSGNNIKADSEKDFLPCSDAGDVDGGDDDADDVFANLDAFDMLVEFPELDLDDKQALTDASFEQSSLVAVNNNLEPKLEFANVTTTSQQRDKKHLLTICDFSPEWSYPEGGVKVLVAGPWTSNSNYTIFFDSQPVPTILVQEGVLRCYCPAHEVGYATLQVSSDGVVISNAVMFEYRHYTHCQQAATDAASTNNCLYKFSLLNRLSTIDERLQLKSEENVDSLTKQCAILLQTNFEEKLVSYCHQLTKGTWKTQLSSSSSALNTTTTSSLADSGYKGMSLLHLAAALGFSKLICAMLNWRADNPNIVLETELDALSQDYHGYTPIAWACVRNHLETVSVLYKWNHDALKIKNHAQQTPLDLAALRGHKQLVTEVYRWEQERLQKHSSGRAGSLGSLGLNLSAYTLNDLHCHAAATTNNEELFVQYAAVSDTQQQHDGVFLRPIAFANQSPPNSSRFSKRSSVDSGINMDTRTRSGKYFKDMTRLHHNNFEAHDQFAATSYVTVDSPLSSLAASNSTATNSSGYSSTSPLRKMDFALCEVSTADTSPLPPDNENDDTSSTINNDDDITDINTDTEGGGGVVGDSDAKVLTLAEHIIAAMPERIKNEADEMMVLGSPMTEPLNTESTGLNDGFMDPLLDSLPNTHFDGDFNFEFNEHHNYRYHEVSTPCSSLSPASSGPLQSPASYSILGTDPSVSSPSPPPSTKQLTEFLHASSSNQYPFEADFSKLTLTDTEQRELYEAAICIQKAYRSYKGRKLEEQNKERTAAIVIQNYYRRYKQYAYYRQMTNAALVIQHGYRSYCKHKRFKKSPTSTISNSFVSNSNHSNDCLSSFYDHFKNDQKLTNSTTSSPKETSPSGPLKRTYSQSTQNQAARKIQQFMRQSRIKLQRERAEKEKLVHQRREEYLQNLLFHGRQPAATEKSEQSSTNVLSTDNLNVIYQQQSHQ